MSCNRRLRFSVSHNPTLIILYAHTYIRILIVKARGHHRWGRSRYCRNFDFLAQVLILLLDTIHRLSSRKYIYRGRPPTIPFLRAKPLSSRG